MKSALLLYIAASVAVLGQLSTSETAGKSVLSIRGEHGAKVSYATRGLHHASSSSHLVRRTSGGKDGPKVKIESPKRKPESPKANRGQWLPFSDSESDSGSSRKSPKGNPNSSPGASRGGSPVRVSGGSPGTSRGASPVRSSGVDQAKGTTRPQEVQGHRQDSTEIPGVGRGLIAPLSAQESRARYPLPGPGLARPGRQQPARGQPPPDSRPGGPPLQQSGDTLPTRAEATSSVAPGAVGIGNRLGGALTSAFQKVAENPGPKKSDLLANHPYRSHEWRANNAVMGGLSRDIPSAAGGSSAGLTVNPLVQLQPVLRNDQSILQSIPSSGSSSGQKRAKSSPTRATGSNLQTGNRPADPERPGSKTAGTGAPTTAALFDVNQQALRMARVLSAAHQNARRSAHQEMPAPGQARGGSAVSRAPSNPSEMVNPVSGQRATQASGPLTMVDQLNRLTPEQRTLIVNRLTPEARAGTIHNMARLHAARAGLVAQNSRPSQGPEAIGTASAGNQPRPASVGNQPNLSQWVAPTGELTYAQRSRYLQDLKGLLSSSSRNQPNPPRTQAALGQHNTAQLPGPASARGQPDLSQWTAPLGPLTDEQRARYRAEMDRLRMIPWTNPDAPPSQAVPQAAPRADPQSSDPASNLDNTSRGRVVTGQPRHGGLSDWGSR